MVQVGRIQRRTEPRAWALALVLHVALLSGCSGTPFAERLSRSFPNATEPTAGDLGAEPVAASSGLAKRPVATTAAPASAGPVGTTGAGQVASPAPGGRTGVGRAAPAGPPNGKPPVSEPAGSAGKAAASAVRSAASTAAAAGAGGKAPSAVQAPPRSGSVALSVPSNPVPYRVTLRLPRADPAAPAEVVTRALRAAGVPFEVETIERMQPAAAPVDGRQPMPAPPATVR
ncbi:MAG: hypothetical protein VKK97_02940 [Synechococcaceae cyanobacterium]|jgi:hypothetical protein|nr:hypothetical protein [Synechococcaceae cyanobacterium]